MKIIREHAPADRYVYDFGICSVANGFAQVDTKQDAWYYGTWASPSRRCVVCYCEGDVSMATADTDEEFVAKIRDMAAWNDQNGWGPMKIDPGLGENGDEIRRAFEAMGLGDLLH